MKIACIVGTRPEIIKCAPVIRAIEQHPQTELLLIHSGQHYSDDMDARIFRDLHIREPHFNLHVGSGSHAEQTGHIMMKIETIFMAEKPEYVLVQGDTNTVLSAALTAEKLHIPVGHIEAGLRSYDKSMPEEINRIVADHISDALFAPTADSADILEHEGIAKDKIIVTGNTIVDSVYQNLEIAATDPNAAHITRSIDREFAYVTAHRAENVDDKKKLRELLLSLKTVTKRWDIALVWPMHPRTKKKIEEFGLTKSLLEIPHLIIESPVGFLESLNLIKQSKFLLTDSGGLQEEACILGTPCITLRDNTERPETVTVGANTLTGISHVSISQAVKRIMESKKLTWPNPFGDGTSSKKIIEYVVGALQPVNPIHHIVRTGHTTAKGSV